MKKFLTLCLVLLTAAALAVPAYADVIAATPGEIALSWVGEIGPIVLVVLVVGVTAGLIYRFWKKK